MNSTDKKEFSSLSKYKLSETENAFIKNNINESIDKLMLSSSKNRPENFKILAEQVLGRQKIKDKLPDWYKKYALFLPKNISLEQSSSQITANYKAKIVNGQSLIDLTGGMGIDFFEMTKNFKNATYIDQQTELTEIATYNAKVFGIKNAMFLTTNSMQYLENINQKYTWIFIDPARRNEHGVKVNSLNDCEPNVIENIELLLSKSENILLKCSPMLDIDLAISQLKQVVKVHIILIDNEVKELLFEINKTKVSVIEIITIQFKKSSHITFKFDLNQEKTCESNIGGIEKYLYEPNAGILKAGAFKLIASQFELNKLHSNTHLYSSSKIINNFPGRCFEIKAIIKPNKKAIMAMIPDLKANLSIRNFPDNVANLKKKLGLRDGGSEYLFACTNYLNEKIVLQTTKIY